MQYTLMDSNGFATLPVSKEAQLLKLAERAGASAPAPKPSAS